jgi:arylsulfatase A-like enzyme
MMINNSDSQPSLVHRTTILAMAFAAAWSSTALGAESRRPNIVLVMADDQGWGQVGYNGHPVLKTPHLDAMAAAGIRFDRFYAAGPVCSPTRASVLTGRTHNRTGVPSHGHNLCLQEKTLPQALKKAGYTTGHFGKWHLNGVRGPGVPVLRDDANHPGRYGFDEWLSVTNYFDLDPLMSRNGGFEQFKGDSSNVIVYEALDFIERQVSEDYPFLAVIWFGSPHNPQRAVEEDRKGFAEGKLADHFGEIVGIDRSIGVLRKGLRELKIERDTLVWYCSDNGGLNLDPDAVGNLRGHKGDLFEGGIRVPGIIEWPGHLKPQITDFPASTTDIMPTIVDLLNLPSDSMLAVRDGESIAAIFDGKTPQRTRSIPFRFQKNAALIDGDYKLLSANGRKGDQWQLFDLKSDPGESKDLSAELPERFARMKTEAEAMLLSVEASAAGEDYPEGKVLQSPRSAFWRDMPEYKPHLEAFSSRSQSSEPEKKRKTDKDER